MRKRSGGKKRKRNPTHTSDRQPQANTESLMPEGSLSWMEGDGLHALLPGEKPSEEMVKQITENYQREIRNSSLFKEWVAQYGKKKALQMLKECRFEVR